MIHLYISMFFSASAEVGECGALAVFSALAAPVAGGQAVCEAVCAE